MFHYLKDCTFSQSWRRLGRAHGATANWALRLLAGSTATLGIVGAIHATIADELSLEQRVKQLGLPAIESLRDDSDYTVFMAPSVPRQIRQQALRKLWSRAVFNQTDGLANYAGDYTIARRVRMAQTPTLLKRWRP